jgi:recombination protein RecA
MRAALLKAQIEQSLPAAFAAYPRHENRGVIPTGIAQIDDAVGGVPLQGLTEICGGAPERPPLPFWGGSLSSCGKTSVLLSLLAQATRDRFCALVDASDNFDPVSGQVAGIDLPRLLWVRCKNQRDGVEDRGPQPACFSPDGVESRIKLPPLEQAFKAADILLQSGGFGLIAVDLSGIPEYIVRKIPLTSWFRFSRVIERQPAALVFLGEQPHATSCAGLVLRVCSDPPELKGNLFTGRKLKIEIRSPGKKPVSSERKVSEPNFPVASKFTIESPRHKEGMQN